MWHGLKPADYIQIITGTTGLPSALLLLHYFGYTTGDLIALYLLFQIVAGLWLNFTALALNHWRMPVKTDFKRKLYWKEYEYLNQHTRVKLLCDRYYVPGWVPKIGHGIASIGDILILSGGAAAYVFILIRIAQNFF